MVKFNIFSLTTEKRRETRHLPLQALNVASLAAKLWRVRTVQHNEHNSLYALLWKNIRSDSAM